MNKGGEQWVLDEPTYVNRWDDLWCGVASEAKAALSDLADAAGDALSLEQRERLEQRIRDLQQAVAGQGTLPDDLLIISLPPHVAARLEAEHGAMRSDGRAQA